MNKVSLNLPDEWGVRKQGNPGNPSNKDRPYGFQIQGAVRARSKEEAESILYKTLISRVEGLSQIIIR